MFKPLSFLVHPCYFLIVHNVNVHILSTAFELAVSLLFIDL